MKAFIVNMSFKDISPPIWRRVILPAGATFNRLHQTIQFVTNFQSDLEPYHFFGIELEDYFITNNVMLMEEYKGKKYMEKTIKSPTHIKIDKYLEKHGKILYTYDFGDDWRINIALEEIVEDYYFGYPTVLDGEGTAPPEDVGGPPGYEEFLKVYQNPLHPDHSFIRTWAEGQFYKPFNIQRLNESLKYIAYKKTEWKHIDHENYRVLTDKYRGNQSINNKETKKTTDSE